MEIIFKKVHIYEITAVFYIISCDGRKVFKYCCKSIKCVQFLHPGIFGDMGGFLFNWDEF